MIYQDIQITVNQGLAVPDKSLYIFRGDSNIILNFKLVNPEYKLTKDMKDNLVTRFGVDNFELRLQLEKGYDRIIKGVITEDGCCRTQLTQNVIQKLRVGTYSYQITLIDDDANAIMTFPICKAKLNILDRMSLTAEELAVPGGLSGEAMADLSVIVKSEDKVEAFDNSGNYIKTNWSPGDIISSAKLNKIEDALDKINQNEKNDAEALDKRVTSNFNVLNSTKADVGGKITISQLDTNAGKIKQEHLDSTLIQQIAGDAAVNTVPANNSITSSMLTSGCITVDKLRSLGYIIKYDISRVKVNKEDTISTFTENLTVSFNGTIWVYGETGAVLKTIKSTSGIDTVYEMPNWSVLVADLSTGVIRVLKDKEDIGGPCVILGINNDGYFSNGLLADIRDELLNRNGIHHQTIITGEGNKQRVNKVIGVSNVVWDKLIIEMRGPAWIALPNGDYLQISTDKINATRGDSNISLTLPDNMQYVDAYRIQIELGSADMLVYNYGKGTIRVQYDNAVYNRDADDIILLSQFQGRITGGALASDISLDTESPFIEYQIFEGFKPLDLIKFAPVNEYGYGKSALVTVNGSAGKLWYYCTDGTKIWYDIGLGRGFLYAETFDGNITDANIFTVEVPHNYCLVYGAGAVRVLPIDSAINSGMKILAACHEGRIKSGILFDVLMHIKEIHADEIDADKKQPIPAYYEEHLTTKINAIKNKHTTYGMAVTSFAFITDMHWTSNTKVSPILLREVCSECNINHIFNGGDWVNNSSSADGVISQIEEIQTMFANNNILDKTMMVLGNHDDNSIYKNASKTVLQERMFDLVFRRISSDSNIVMDSDAEAMGYYYKDDNFNRIRYIVLNCIDTVYQIDNTTDTITYGGQHSYEFRKRQTDWFCNEALKVPNDKWNVVVCSHVPPVTTNISGSDKAPNYGQHLINILNAFKNKTSYTATASGGTFGAYSIDVDFKDKGGNVIAWLAGHVHYDNIVQNNDINIVTTLNNDTSVWADAPTKTTGTHTEQAFDVFTVNTKTRTVHVTRIGAGSDRSFTY